MHRFRGCLNYVADSLPMLREICKPLFQSLQKNPLAWSQEHTSIVKYIKSKVKFSCLDIPYPHAFMPVKTYASTIDLHGILEQLLDQNLEPPVKFHSGAWTGSQINYSTIKKKILSIVLCISKFQDNLHYKRFLL